MADVISFNDEILEQVTTAPGNFVGKILDISAISPHFASHLNAEIAAKFNVTPEQMAVEAVEDLIRKAAAKANIQVVALWKDLTDIDGEAKAIMRERITLLK